MISKMIIRAGERNEAHLLKELESSIQNVAHQAKGLCEYLQELRVGKNLLRNYSEQYVGSLIDKVVHKAPVLPVMNPIVCGTTKNNIDQFDWLTLQVQRHNPGQVLVNTSLPPWSNIRSKVGLDKKTKITAARIICDCIDRGGLQPYHADFVFNYALNFIKFFISFGLSKVDCCPFVCVSNDHTPINMGFAKAAKAHGLYRIYLQHAFVTDLFPALDFDLSLLFNRRSAEVYGAEDEIGKSVLVIPRYPVLSVSENELSYKKEIKCIKKKIVIYLGGSNDFGFLRRTIDLLLGNSLCEDVKVKLHPNPVNHSIKKDLIKLYGPEIVGVEDIIYPHIAICGNSSVVMKLLSMGVRCYHLFDLDTRRRDYYGFVASGAVRELVLSELSKDFWVGWDESAYKTNRSRFVEDPISSESENHLTILDNILKDKLNKNRKLVFLEKSLNNKKNKYVETGDHKLSLTSGEFIYLNSLLFCAMGCLSNENLKDRLDLLNSKEKVALLVRCYRFRHPRAIDLMLAAVKYDTSRWVRIFFKYHSGVLVGLKGFDGWREDIDYIYSHECELKNPEVVSSEILTYAGTAGWREVLLVLSALSKYSVKYDRINSKSWSKAYAVLPNDEREKFEADQRYHLLVKKINKTKMFFSNSSSHSVLVESYLSTISGTAKESLATVFQVVENWICDNDVEDLRLARLNEDYVDRFWRIVADALSSGRGFSLIRLSDGEGFIFSSNIFTVADCRNRERHWWGCELHEAHRLRIQQQLLSAVRQSDVIGVPSVFRFMRDLPANSVIRGGIYKSVQTRGLLEVLNGFMQCEAQPLAVVEERANDYLFLNLFDRLKALSHLIDKIVLISSLPDHVVNTAFAVYRDFVSIKIPTRSRTFNQPGRDLPEGKILPYVYRDIIELVRHHSKPGVVLLVAAGVIGKLFIDVGKQCGAVALDIGEVVERL